MRIKERDADKLYRIRNTNNIVGYNERVKADIRRIAKLRKEEGAKQRIAYDVNDVRDAGADKIALPELLQVQYLHIGATVQTKHGR